MKNLIKGMIVFLSVLLIGLVVFLTSALVGGDDRVLMFGGLFNRFSEHKLINTQTVALEDVSDIVIKNYSSDVVFLRSDSEEMIIKEYRGNKSVKNTFLTIQKNGSTINIESDKKNSTSWIVFGNNHRCFEVYLPETYQDAMKLDTSSGDILAEADLKFTECSINASSGDISLATLSAEKIEVKTTSGDILIKEINGEKNISTHSGDIHILRGTGSTRISATSGDVILKDVDGSMDINTSSGFVKVENLSGLAKVKTSSGDVQLILADLSNNLDIETTSGDVFCNLPDDSEFQFQADTTSGDVMTYFDRNLSFNRSGTRAHGTFGDSADVAITVNTTSGDVKVTNR